ncbi:hypothetical protein [Streptomyces ipomoeae]|uniref:hypothetical protein n=1 Tax=Streptomyces ipomoeae TaxID=103232 RepID=UPI0029A0A804|nr:hypothetical protein [Streptomyces ipomoeae]MDX2692207.1 hypothetical protein [Streptomyces ipomoeae]MDX2843567.1 hypothetical protein [Streptomyces ipomoeae]
MTSPSKQQTAERRSAVLQAARHQRTARAALTVLTARGIAMRVSRLTGVTSSVTQVHFAHAATTGMWMDRHGFHQHRSHSVTIESLPLYLAPELFNAVPLPEDSDRWRAGRSEPEDFTGEAVQYLYARCTGPMAATRWTPMPGHEDEEEPPRFTEAFWVGDAYVSLSGPGTDAVVKAELNNLNEFRAHRLMEAYATLITTPVT